MFYRIAVALLLASHAPAAVTLLTSPNPAQFGQPVTLTATASTTVTFYDAATILGIAPSINGQAILTTTLLSAGEHSLRAYAAGQSSPVVAQLIGAAPSPANAFPTTTAYTTGGSGGTPLIADFNGDGIPDIAFPSTSNNIAILPGRGDGAFGAPVISPTAGIATGMAIADFNLDGKPDLAVVNGNAVSILLGNGDGSFQKAISLPVGSRTLTVGDFNGDGKPDLVVASNAANNVSILLGNGDGTFQSPATIPTTFQVTSAAVADFNSDGIADIAIIGATAKMSLLLGNGDGTFQAAINFNLPAQNAIQVLVADFNADGKADLAIAQYGVISILLGNGDATFQPAANYAVISGTPSVAVADVNADGIPDLIAQSGALLDILLGNGDGSFQTPLAFPLSGTVAAGDFNGDGKVDLALGAYSPAGYGVTVALGALLQATTTTLNIAPSPGHYNQPVTLTATVSPATATGTVLFFNGATQLASAKLVNGQAVASTSFLVIGTFTLQAAYAGDTNNGASVSSLIPLTIGPAPATLQLSVSANPVLENAKLVLTATTSAPSGAVAFYQGTTLLGTAGVINLQASLIIHLANPGTYPLSAIYGGSTNYQIATSNTITEVVTGTLPPVSVTLTSSANPSIFGQPVTLTASLAPATATGTVSFYDGVTVLGTAPISNGQATFTTSLLPAGAQSLKAYYSGDANNGANTSQAIPQTVSAAPANRLRQTQTYSTSPDSESSITVADFNGDGIADLAYVDLNTGVVSVLLGRGDGAFAPAVNSPGLKGASRLTVADFNGDGKPDLIVAGYPGMVTLLGNGDGTFQPPIPGTGTSTYYPMVAADFNGDGKVDLAVINNGIIILLGNGDGTFQVGLNTGYAGSTAIAAGDFNGDGHTDLAAATSSGVLVFLGNGDGTFQLGKTYPSAVYGAIAVGDFNGDGKLDIVTGNSSVTVLLGNGDGTFQPTPVTSTARLTSAIISVSDFNGDGNLDIVGTNAEGFSILYGNGDGSFQAPLSFPAPQLSTLAVGEFNGDGKTDLAALANSASLTIYLGDQASPTSLTLTSSTNPSKLGQAVTLAATVSPASATGSVTFEDGAQVLGVAPLANGRAQLTTLSLSPGPQSLQAFYSGDAANLASTSAALPQQVGTPAVPANAFATPLTFGAGLEPLAVAAGDFNNDGKPDLAVANFGGVAGGGSVSILLGNGDGTFQPAVDYPAGNGVGAIAIADVNGDGKADLVVTNYYDGTVSVLLGNGDATFQPPLTFPAGKNPLAIVIGDFNRDGIPDLAVANYSTTGAGFNVLLGNGDGAFQTAVGYGGGDALSIAAGDFFGDGVIDLAVGTYFGIGIFHGNGDGTFVGQTTVGNDVVYSIAIADLNGDGHPDIAYTSYNNGEMRVALNTGYGGFLTPSYYATALDPRSLVVADFNGDGHPDLAVANFSGSVTMFNGKGDGAFQPAVTYPWTGNPTALAVADLNHDGRMDLIVANENNTITVLLGVQQAVTTTTLSTTPNPSALNQIVTLTATVAPSDATGVITFYDGAAPLGANPIVNGQATLHHRFTTNNGPHSLTASYAGSAIYSASTSAAIIQALSAALPSSITTLTSSSNAANYGQPITLTATINHSDATGRVAFFDGVNVLGSSQVNQKATLTVSLTHAGTRTLYAYYSGDAHYAASSGSMTQQVLLNPATTFQTLNSFPTGKSPFAIAAADLNADGKTDLAIANSGDNTVSILLGNGDGTFQPAVNYPAGVYPYSIAAGDFNGDGNLDLAVVNNGGNNVSILLGNGDGTFQPPSNFPTGHAPYALTTGDFDRDGNLDLAVVNLLDNNVSILFGNGDGTFQLPVNYGYVNHPDSIAVTDWNGDGIPDLAVANQFGGYVSIYYGQSNSSFTTGGNIQLGIASGPTAIVSGSFGLAVTSYNGTLQVLPATAHGSVSILPVGQYPWALATASIDPLGLDAIIVANEGSNNISVILDRGAFQPAVNYSTGAGPVAIAVGDFNADGKADIAIVNYFDNTVTVMLGSSPN